jgi:muramoyltetrapeptide carboxypeptidase
MGKDFFELKPVSFRGEVAVVAPASPFDKMHFNAGITELKLNKLRPLIDRNIFLKEGFLAGTDKIRAELLISAFSTQSIEVVWTARGGYGSIRLLETLDQNIQRIKENPKLFVGFSDVTAIHSWLVEKCGFVTVHGPNITTLSTVDKYSKIQVFEMLATSEKAFTIFNKNIRAVNHGKAKGIVKGGNLTTIASLIGTPYEPDFKNCILFLEEVGEVPYRVDRLITQLRLAGKFKDVKGVILGDFSYKEFRPPAEKSVNPFAIVESMGIDRNVPVICNFPAGHGAQNMAFLLGASAQLDTESRTLKYDLS